ncbi:sterol-4-alpha-carboxylate 3-dehydrogenase like protein [Xylariales sp. AK1849]|nr:sterol-4-alpha-carboxylate 3-dehydrogenase like protein [Xylariales sp. AK1849]
MASESYLVTGGCGLQGSSIVETLRSKYPTARVAVLTRNPTINTFPGVTYHRGDITIADDIASALSISQPTVVFHCAATVVAARKHVSDATIRAINVGGTRLLLEKCAGFGVRAFVFTSSGSVVQRDFSPLDGADETWPMVQDADPKALIYPKTKAASDRLVTAADDKNGMRTCAIRPAIIHGERDSDVTAITMQMRRASGIQIGDNTNRVATTYVGNSTQAHLLAAAKLLDPDPEVRDQVGGEAFFATNEESYTFTDFTRAMWQHAGVGDGPRGQSYKNVRVIPTSVALCLAWAAEWWAWVWGTTPKISRVPILTTTMTRWYDLSKARRVLGYKPDVGWEEGVRRAATWYLEHQKEEGEAKSK